MEIYNKWEEMVLKILKFFESFLLNYFDIFEELNEGEFCIIIQQLFMTYFKAGSFNAEVLQSKDEEIVVKQITVVLSILNCYSDKLLDLSPPSLNLFLSSIYVILPKLKKEFLDYPKICEKYFSVLSSISSKPSFFSSFSSELFQLVLSILMEGISHKSSFASKQSLESLKTILTFNYSHKFVSTKGEFAFQLHMQNFPNVMPSIMVLLLESLVFQRLNSDCIELAIDCFLAVYFDYKDHFFSYLENLLLKASSKVNNNPVVIEAGRNIINEAAKLSNGINSNFEIFESKNFAQFRSNFRSFQNELQKFLLISNFNGK